MTSHDGMQFHQFKIYKKIAFVAYFFIFHSENNEYTRAYPLAQNLKSQIFASLFCWRKLVVAYLALPALQKSVDENLFKIYDSSTPGAGETFICKSLRTAGTFWFVLRMILSF